MYVDDMLVKSKEESAHLDDLQETFATLRQYQMKLNPSKCAFGVASPKVLLEKNRSEPREGMSHTRDGVTQDSERSLEAHRKNSSAQQIRLESNGQMLAFLQDTEACLRLERQV